MCVITYKSNLNKNLNYLMFPVFDLIILLTSHNQWPILCYKIHCGELNWQCIPMFLTMQLLKSLVQVISHFEFFFINFCIDGL